MAAKILADGEIRCRNDAGPLLCDVANQGALWNNPDAHNYVRLYFRPRNSFHLKTEGIKRIGSQWRQDPHMSIPVMLVFDLERVLTSAGAFFLPSNFAHAGAQPLNGDNAFAQLPFAKIYHDSSLPTSPATRAEILDARMAEVVFDRPLPVDLLTTVVCRTSHELETLKSFVPAGAVARPMVVEQNGSIFMRREIYVDEIYTKAGHIYLGLTNWSGADPKVT